MKEVINEIGIEASVDEFNDGILIKFSEDFSKDLSWQNEEYVSNVKDSRFVPMFMLPLEKLPMYDRLNSYFEKYWLEHSYK